MRMKCVLVILKYIMVNILMKLPRHLLDQLFAPYHCQLLSVTNIYGPAGAHLIQEVYIQVILLLSKQLHRISPQILNLRLYLTIQQISMILFTHLRDITVVSSTESCYLK